jgi:hypothetical protein
MIRYNTKRYWGYSTDTKPKGAQFGDRFLEVDTAKEYYFGSYNEWILFAYIPFLRNETNRTLNIVGSNESIFNPCDLNIRANHIFIVEDNACYYVLGDLTNNGELVVDGELKVGGELTGGGPITGSGIIT